MCPFLTVFQQVALNAGTPHICACEAYELYTKGKGKGLYAATNHFFACKSYGTTIVIVTAQPTPTILLQLNL